MTMNTTPTTAVVVTHEVENYEVWKRAFDQHAESRRSAGVVSTHINRDAAQPNLLSVYIAGNDAAKLASFLHSADLAQTMLNAGVKGPPHVAKITPVVDATRKNASAGAIVRHTVADFATWKAAFDGHAPAREAAGIVGYAVNRSVDNPNLVIVYLQASSIDQLRAFASSASLKEVMKGAGVTSAPEISFVQGGAWEA
jgi:quinol monooxygenase YgiN